jgi:quercetin dioxygenase-like cupin family protein
MKVIDAKKVSTHEGKAPLFTGGIVHGQYLISEKNIEVGRVEFNPGAGNVFHTHSSEQVLFVTEGKGIVATEDKEVTVTPGMTIYIPAGEKHWHGATKDSSFAHLSIHILPVETNIVEGGKLVFYEGKY